MTKLYKRIVFVFLILCAISVVFTNGVTSAAPKVVPPRATAPNVGNIAVEGITDVSADVTFTVDQIDASAVVHYGTTQAMTKKSGVNIDASLTRTITLSGLSAGQKYYYSVYANNGTDPSKSYNSPTDNFVTNVTQSGPSEVAPIITNVTVVGITDSTVNISFSVDQPDADTIVNYGTTTSLGTLSKWDNSTSLNRNIMLSGLLNSTGYSFSIRVYNGTNMSYYTDSKVDKFTTINGSAPSPTPTPTPTPVAKIVPTISVSTPEQSINTTVNIPIKFTVSFATVANVAWYLDDVVVKNESLVQSSYYNGNAAVVGVYNVTVVGSNDNGSVSYSWNFTVNPVVFGTGNRIWDGSKSMSTTYMWNAFSFAGFYYDVDTNMGTEELVINNISRLINVGDITYRTSPQEVNFGYSEFGKYQVVGFMANKYFAGYKNTTIPGPTNNFGDISTISQGQLHKVLIDDDSKRTISVGGTIALQEGYVLKATDIDLNARTMLLVLLKDGAEVDTSPLSAGNTYVYSKRVGNVEGLPLILVRFDSVFSGQEMQAAFIKGIFQISDVPTLVHAGDTFGSMEVSGINGDNITMDNRDTVGLSPGSTIDLMGDLKIIVADDSNKLRFALSVERTGAFDVRGTVYPVTKEWTPMNFGLDVGGTNIGFYYDLDEDIGTEDLKVDSISGNTIPAGGLIYSTSPQQVSFNYSNFGKYQVVGFMADKYFAGYSGQTIPGPTNSFGDISTISQGQLHKVLIDDDVKRTIAVGGTIALQDGYVLKAKDIDLNARTMLLSLIKDGVEVDTSPLSADQTYVYSKRVGNVESLPLIMVRFDNVFSGQELQTAFLKGMFQIAETPTTVNVGDSFGNMEVNSVSQNSITMSNKASIGLSSGNTVDVMGDIKFKVADSGDVRFYPFVSVTPDMVGTQLEVNIPTRATGGDTISINVTAGGIPIEGASIVVAPETGLTSKDTDTNGTANFTFPKRSKGTYKVTATKTGYESANRTIDIQQYIEGALNMNVPTTIDQFQNIPIHVTANGTGVNNTSVAYDNVSIGTTDENGNLNYTFNDNGSHTLNASKDSYIGVSIDVNIRAPFSEFKAQDINVTPSKTFTGEEIVIMSNITNSGTKEDTKSIDLIINGTSVDNVSVTLSPKETKDINFTHKISLPEGNYTVEILEQKTLVEVQKEQTYTFLIMAIIATIIGAIVIYVGTTKRGREQLKLSKDAISKLIKR
jgi:S-layer protein (TIGR01567 family)